MIDFSFLRPRTTEPSGPQSSPSRRVGAMSELVAAETTLLSALSSTFDSTPLEEIRVERHCGGRTTLTAGGGVSYKVTCGATTYEASHFYRSMGKETFQYVILTSGEAPKLSPYGRVLFKLSSDVDLGGIIASIEKRTGDETDPSSASFPRREV